MNAANQAAARPSETYSDTGEFVGAIESVELADFTNSQRMQHMDASARPSASYPEDIAPGGWPFQQARLSIGTGITHTFDIDDATCTSGDARFEVSPHGKHVLYGYFYTSTKVLVIKCH